MSAAKDSFSQIEELFVENAKGFLTYEKLVKLLDKAPTATIVKKIEQLAKTNKVQLITSAEAAKLRNLADAKKRQENARKLNDALAGVAGIKTPTISDNRNHVYHQYTILLNKGMQRDQFIASLRDKGVGAGIYYPKPLHIYPHIAKLGYKVGDFPVAEDLAARVVSLPVHPKVTDEDIEVIAAAIKESINGQ